MKYLFLLLVLIPAFVLAQQTNIDKSVSDKFELQNFSSVQTVAELAGKISELTSNKKEQLTMLLLWTNKNMYVDSLRFFYGGNQLETDESFKKRIALCNEFSNILDEFCKQLKIPSIRVEGYVKFAGFKPGDKFDDVNHAWNAVFIDSTWTLCDLFWSTYVLKYNNAATSRFVKRLSTKYFLAAPNAFIVNHLPCDPIFQFNNYPITVNAFTSKADSIDLTISRMPLCNYNDSIKWLMKLKKDDCNLQIARHAYTFNKDNPNMLIIEYYNDGVAIVNNKAPTKLELLKAKNYFTSALTLINQSSKNEIVELKENCQQAITNINKRIK